MTEIEGTEIAMVLVGEVTESRGMRTAGQARIIGADIRFFP